MLLLDDTLTITPDETTRHPEDQLLFVYGTLRRGCRNHHLLRSAEFVGKAHTKKRFALYSTNIPYVIKWMAVSPIIGEVYRVDAFLLAALDVHEGHPYWYRRERVAVVLDDGEELQAWLYFFDRAPQGKLLRGGDFTVIPQGRKP